MHEAAKGLHHNPSTWMLLAVLLTTVAAVFSPFGDAPLGHVRVLRLKTALQAAAAAAAVPSQQGPPTLPVLPDGIPDIERRLLTQLDDLKATCPWRPEWRSCHGADRSSWTAANLTRVCCQTGGEPGTWHTFKLQTYLANGEAATAGGDVWNVPLTGPGLAAAARQRPLRTRVLDNGDGTYTVAFMPLFDGQYSVAAWLFYSRCTGYQDAPGNAPLEHVTIVSQQDWCFIGALAALPAITVADTAASKAASDVTSRAPALLPIDTPDPRILRVQQHVFALPGRATYRRPLSAAQAAVWRTSRDTSRFVLFGDSTTLLGVVRHILAVKNKVKRPALLPFPHCWNLSGGDPVHFTTATKTRMSFSFVEEPLAPVLTPGAPPRVHYVRGHGCDLDTHPALVAETLRNMTSSDTLFINIGMHCVQKYRLANFTLLIEQVAALLAAAPSKPHIVWRSTDAAEQNMPLPSHGTPFELGTYLPQYQFLNEARRLWFDLEATATMRRHGVRVIDMYGLPTHHGNVVHYSNDGFLQQNQLLSWAVC